MVRVRDANGAEAPLLQGDGKHALLPDNDSHPFWVGPALSVYQNAGGPNTNWSEYETHRNHLGQPVIEGGDRCGKSTNFWEYYEADIERAVSLNSTCFRLSLEWGRIEPQKGIFDPEAVQHYHDIFDCLLRNKLEPVVTLHHFVHPLWFDALGGFTTDAGIPHFVSFATFAVREFGAKVKVWATFNEANVMGFCGWLWGQFPPGKFARFKTAGRHLLTCLRAHGAAYIAIKRLPGGADMRVGIVHNHMSYAAKDPGGFSIRWVQPVIDWLDRVWGTAEVVRYFRTGRFCWRTPPLCGGPVEAADTPPGVDWVGLNYYGRSCIDWRYESTCREGDVMTDMPLALYPQGLYDGIVAVAELGVPIYITETGIADAKGDRRAVFLDTYVPQIERAVSDGYDVRGLMVWTLIDNFEWAHGFHIKFGWYAWSPGDGAKRVARPATRLLASLFAELPGRMAGLRAKAPAPASGKPPSALEVGVGAGSRIDGV